MANSCGCGSTSKVATTISTAPTKTCFGVEEQSKLPEVVIMASGGEYDIHTLVHKEENEPFFPTTHIKATLDDCGNTLDSILRRFDDRLNEFDTTRFEVKDCSGCSHEINVVTNNNVKVVDNFTTDSGSKALSTRRGKMLYDYMDKSNTLEIKDPVDTSTEETYNATKDLPTTLELKDASVNLDKLAADVMAKFEEIKTLSLKVDEYVEKFNEDIKRHNQVINFFREIIIPTVKLLPYKTGINSTHILKKNLITPSEVTGASIKIPLRITWNATVLKDGTEVEVEAVEAIIKLFDEDDLLLNREIISDEGKLPKTSKGSEVIIYPTYFKGAVRGELTVSTTFQSYVYDSEVAEFTIQDSYDIANDFNCVGITSFGYKSLDDTTLTNLNLVKAVGEYPKTYVQEGAKKFTIYEYETEEDSAPTGMNTPEYRTDTLYYSEMQAAKNPTSINYYYYNKPASWYKLNSDGTNSQVVLTNSDKITIIRNDRV